jgi:hypothetical protein
MFRILVSLALLNGLRLGLMFPSSRTALWSIGSIFGFHKLVDIFRKAVTQQ